MRTTISHRQSTDYLETSGMFLLITALTIAITTVAVYAYAMGL